MIKKIFFALALVSLVLPLSAHAADIRSQNDLKIEQKLKNAYLFGDKVDVQSDTESDLFAAANELNIAKETQKSLFAAGANVKIAGNVGENAKIVAGQLDQSGRIGEDLIAFYGTGNFTKSEIGGDVILFGGDTKIDCNTQGKTKIFAGSVELQGNYSGDVEIRSDKFTVGDKTVIKGKLIHSGSNQAKISELAKIEGGTEYHELEKRPVGFGKFKTFSGVFGVIESILALFIATLLLSSMAKPFTKTIIDYAENNKIQSALYGLVAIVVVPILTLICMISLIGGILATIMIVGYILAMVLSYCFAAIFIGRMFFNLIKDIEQKGFYLQCLVGSFLIIVISFIPFVGSWIIFIFFLIILGSIAGNLVQLIKKSTSNKDV